MLGVEDHRDVEGLQHLRLRHPPLDQVEDVLGEAVLRVGRHHRLPLGGAVGRGDRGRDLGEQPHRLPPLRRVGDVARLRVLKSHEGHRGADRVHRMGVGGEFADDAVQRRADLALGGGLGLEGRELRGVRQLAVPQQVGDLLERTGLGQVLHGIAAIGQAVGLRHHLRDGGDIGVDADQALIDRGFLRGFAHGSRSSVWSDIARGARTVRLSGSPSSLADAARRSAVRKPCRTWQRRAAWFRSKACRARPAGAATIASASSLPPMPRPRKPGATYGCSSSAASRPR